MHMKNPVHPGRVVRHDCLEPLGLSVTAGAKVLGVTRQALDNVVSGKSGIGPRWRYGIGSVLMRMRGRTDDSPTRATRLRRGDFSWFAGRETNRSILFRILASGRSMTNIRRRPSTSLRTSFERLLGV